MPRGIQLRAMSQPSRPVDCCIASSTVPLPSHTPSCHLRMEDDAEGDLGLSPALVTPVKQKTQTPTRLERADSPLPLHGSRMAHRPPDIELGSSIDRANLTPLRQVKQGISASPSSPSLQVLTSSDYDSESTPLRPRADRSSSSYISRSRTMPRMRTPSIEHSTPTPASPSENRLAPVPIVQDRLDEETVLGMQRWVQEIAVCNFDLDRGPVVDYRMAGRAWGKGEKDNV